MIRKFTLLFLACLGIYSLSMAQKCGFDEMHNKRMATDPEYASFVNQFNASMLAWIQQQQNGPQGLPTTYNGGKAWEIPVVVHVMHTGQAISNIPSTFSQPNYNPSDALITAYVNYLSQAFTASYPGHLVEASGGTRIPIVFKLAQRTPTPGSCVSSNGILRFDLSSNTAYNDDGVGTPGISDASLKAYSYWRNSDYYNIWLVYKIDGYNWANPQPGGTTLGYAYFPTGAPSLVDGTVMLADQLLVGNATITHELGHAFSLYHLFQGGSTTVCPPFPDDFVTDTEPIRQFFTCPPNQGPPVPTNPCTGVAYGTGSYNFMSYASCDDRFTPGQRDRVWATLSSLTTPLVNINPPTIRTSLISSLGSTACGGPAITNTTCSSPITGPVSPSPNNLGPRAVTIVKLGPPDSLIMNAMSSGYNNDGNLHYFDRTSHHRVNLVGGQPYTCRVSVGPNNEFVRAWIDYDNNGTFSVTEQIFSPVTSYSGTGTAMTFVVPMTATSCVPLRMRVITNTGNFAGPCTTPINGQCEDYEVIINGGTGSGVIVPNLVTLNVHPTVGNPSCAGSGMKIFATWPTGVTPVWFQWFKKTTTGIVTVGPTGSAVDTWASGPTYPPNTFLNLDTVWVRMAIPGVCGSDTTLDSVVLFRPITIPPAVTIGVTGGTNPTCVDDNVVLSVINNVNPGGNPNYNWRRNGITVQNGTSNTYTIVNNVSGSSYDVIMTSTAGAPCAIPSTATSLPIVVTNTTKAPTVSIALTTGTNPGCAGQLLTFTASGTTTGTTPTYQWRVNGINQGAASPNNQFSTVSLNNGDVVSCVMTSSSLCAVPTTATSNNISIVQQLIFADITIAQVSGGNPACGGHPVIFSATPVNSGPNPQFQWLINNNPVLSANAPVFNTTTLVNGDVVKCILISSDPCVVNTLDTSNAIQMQVTPSKVPKISFTITAGKNPWCLDSPLEFTAVPVDAGTNPQYEWLVNGFQLNLNNAVYSAINGTSNLLNNDVVIARIVPTDGGCYLPDTGYSLPMIMVRSPTPDPPIISLLGNILVTNISGSFIWYGPPNGTQLSGGTDGKYHPGELGKYWALTDNNGCPSLPSNILTITLLDINDIGMEPAKIYPNPTTGILNIDWGHAVNMTVDVFSTVGQKLIHEKVVNRKSKEIDLGNLSNGMYFVVISDESGRTSTTRVTVTR